MSWTQVYVTGLPRSPHPTDEEIEAALESRYGLSSSSSSSSSYSSNLTDDDVMMSSATAVAMGWAGRGTTIIKRDDSGRCRGFAFLSFHSAEGASVAIGRINNGNDDEDDDGGQTPGRPKLRAEMSAAPSNRERRKKGSGKEDGDVLPDLRLKRQRKKPVCKHPVIISSSGRKTNLGNKTK